MGRFIAAAGALALAFTQTQAWWQPAVGTTWQIVLIQPLKNTSEGVQAYDFDLFDNPKSTIDKIHAGGNKAICYFSAGSYERWRKDADEFEDADLGSPLDGWPGERWLDTNSDNVRRIMRQRMDLAQTNGCDAIDPDNMDAYQNKRGGLGLTKADAIDYVKFLAAEGHSRGMAVGLKNAGGIIPQVLDDVDFAVNEQCLKYKECQVTRPFINAGKPVFHIEYVKGTPSKDAVNKTCTNKTRAGFSTLIKHMNLDTWTMRCPGAASRVKKCRNASPQPDSPGSSPSNADNENAGIQLSSWTSLLVVMVSLAVLRQF